MIAGRWPVAARTSLIGASGLRRCLRRSERKGRRGRRKRSQMSRTQGVRARARRPAFGYRGKSGGEITFRSMETRPRPGARAYREKRHQHKIGSAGNRFEREGSDGRRFRFAAGRRPRNRRPLPFSQRCPRREKPRRHAAALYSPIRRDGHANATKTPRTSRERSTRRSQREIKRTWKSRTGRRARRARQQMARRRWNRCSSAAGMPCPPSRRQRPRGSSPG